MTDKKPVQFIFRTDRYDLDSSNYLFNEKFKKVRERLNDRRYTSQETNLTYRILSHWASFGILPQGAQVTEGWHKFTMLELIWLRVCLRLRDFGVPLERLEKVKQQVLDWSSKNQEYWKFEYYVSKAWFSSDDPYVLLLQNGFAEVATLSEISLSRAMNSIPTHSDMILVSLKSILEEIGITPVKADTPHYLTKEEFDLLAAIRIKTAKEIKVSLDDKRRITGIEEIKEEINPEAINEAYKEMKDSNAYGEVQTKYVQGKPVAQKISKKTKYNSKSE